MIETPQPSPARIEAVAFADMGAPLEETRQALIACCRDILAEVEPRDRDIVNRALPVLQNLTCKIAVIGQVKAGKSSFISSLVGRPDLLPSDANPWTTVVTNLHFENRDPPAESVLFTFFSGDEWRRIAEGGGPLRELTERLVPGFDAGVLTAQLEAMRRRAEQRLGRNFKTMLGQSHSFSKVDREVLARYVSAGSDSLDVSSGWLSDITKSADLYIGSPRKGLPITIVDTPGTNDPLLVRDEITRLNVSSGDLFVVMLTAQQPLSSADIALLRLLRGLHKDRLVVFLNRVDGLADPADNVDRVIAHIEERLQGEFPGARLPIVAGSARWASLAIAGSDTEVAAVFAPSIRDYARKLGLDVTATIDAGDLPATRVVLMTLSGIPDVVAAIGRTMQHGSAGYALHQQAQMLFHLAQSSERAQLGQIRALRRALDETRSNAETRKGQLQAWRQELEQLDAASRQLQENLTFYEQSLAAIVARCGNDLRLLLGECLGRFVDQQLEDLHLRFQQRRKQTWRSDPSALRKDLQQEFLRVYGYWEGMLQQVDSQIMTELKRLMPRFAAPAESSSDPSDGPLLPAPGFDGLGRTQVFDLSTPWWRSWWSAQPTAAELASKLERLLRGEFDPLILDLIAAATATLEERSRQAARQARLCTLDIVDGIRRRSAELMGGLQADPGAASPETVRRLAAELQIAEKTVLRWGDLRTRLSTLLAQCHIMLDEKGTG